MKRILVVGSLAATLVACLAPAASAICIGTAADVAVADICILE